MNRQIELPTILSGPMLRHVEEHAIHIWVVTSIRCDITCILPQISASHTDQTTWRVGTKAYINLIKVDLSIPLVCSQCYDYDLMFKSSEYGNQNLKDAGFEHTYAGCSLPNFRWQKHISNLLHGSCRKAHFHDKDALPQLDHLISQEYQTPHKIRPDLAIFHGDQVYVDDVAGPMLSAIHQVIEMLGLWSERFEGALVDDLEHLLIHENSYYQRERLLPSLDSNKGLANAFFKGKQKPIFTSVNAQNHLIGLSEMVGLYLLSWSPTLWQFINISAPKGAEIFSEKYNEELKYVLDFSSGLHQVQRAFAHIPCYMIFDDHDVTDDWNLTRGWEEQIYGHPFSKRIVGNALIAYQLFQGCGNPTENADVLAGYLSDSLKEDGLVEQQPLIDKLLAWDKWHYTLDTNPPIHVLDTRTQRWRSELSLNKPSGLMDWESLCDLQSKLIDQHAVIMVSPAPIYGVKFIETIQRLFTFFGGALIVDAENWMSHKGTASVMLNIFRHIKTPPNFIILSGDVHYSFVYDVKLRFRRHSPNITQFTSSGIHNEFPKKLLTLFDCLNSWLYGSKSPLNFLTQRRNMSVKQRLPTEGESALVNKCNIGQLILNKDASEVECQLVCNDGSLVSFSKSHK